jgi:hypothetical protein
VPEVDQLGILLTFGGPVACAWLGAMLLLSMITTILRLEDAKDFRHVMFLILIKMICTEG